MSFTVTESNPILGETKKLSTTLISSKSGDKISGIYGNYVERSRTKQQGQCVTQNGDFHLLPFVALGNHPPPVVAVVACPPPPLVALGNYHLFVHVDFLCLLHL